MAQSNLAYWNGVIRTWMTHLLASARDSDEVAQRVDPTFLVFQMASDRSPSDTALGQIMNKICDCSASLSIATDTIIKAYLAHVNSFICTVFMH